MVKEGMVYSVPSEGLVLLVLDFEIRCGRCRYY